MPRISKHRDTTVSDKEVVPEAGARYRESGLVLGSFSDARRNFLGVRNVPLAEAQPFNLNVCFWEVRFHP